MIPFFPKISLAAALTGLALGCNAIAGQSLAPSEGPVDCSIEMTNRGGVLTLEGVVSTAEPLRGTYHLQVSRGGTSLNQGGPFRLSAGETVRLGRLTLGGPSSDLDAELTLNVAGGRLRCPAQL